MRSKVCLAQHEGHVFIVMPALTPAQIRIVQESFRLFSPEASRAARIFYNNLFHLAPEIRPLFPDDMTQQENKFVQMLATVIKSLRNVSTISDHLSDLGRRHASYEVREKHYAIVGQALLSTLNSLLGPRFTAEVQEAWSAAFNMLARIMLEAAATPYATGNFYGSIIRDVVTSQYGVAESRAPRNALPRQAVPRGSLLQKKQLL